MTRDTQTDASRTGRPDPPPERPSDQIVPPADNLAGEAARDRAAGRDTVGTR
jgi:hypothetical protein